MLMEITITPDRIQGFLVVASFILAWAIPSILDHKPNKKQLPH